MAGVGEHASESAAGRRWLARNKTLGEILERARVLDLPDW
jgi:hypothetical protein